MKNKDIDLIVFTISGNKINNEILYSDFINKVFKVHPVSVFAVPENKHLIKFRILFMQRIFTNYTTVVLFLIML